MVSLLILADDLSGAADCGIVALAAGLEASVALDAAHAQARSPVLAIDLNSRNLCAADAGTVHANAIRQHYRPEDQLLYKKIDSTLRGNVVPEVAACVRTAAQRRLAIVAPAFPAAGRTTRGGRVYVHGKPLQETEVWRHSGTARSTDLRALLAAAGLNTMLADLAAVRQGSAALEHLLRLWADAGVEAAVCDAETDADPRAIAAAGVALHPSVLLVGSAGLAHQLPLLTAKRGEASMALPQIPAASRVVAIVGSMSSVSREQAKWLEDHTDCVTLTIAPEVLKAGHMAGAWAEAAERIKAALELRDAVIVIGKGESIDPREGALLCANLSQMIAPHIASIGALIATGGETARALLAVMHVSELRLVREIEPGVALACCGGSRALPVVIKAGAFGSVDTLLNAYRVLSTLRAAGNGDMVAGHSQPQVCAAGRSPDSSSAR